MHVSSWHSTLLYSWDISNHQTNHAEDPQGGEQSFRTSLSAAIQKYVKDPDELDIHWTPKRYLNIMLCRVWPSNIVLLRLATELSTNKHPWGASPCTKFSPKPLVETCIYIIIYYRIYIYRDIIQIYMLYPDTDYKWITLPFPKKTSKQASISGQNRLP